MELGLLESGGNAALLFFEILLILIFTRIVAKAASAFLRVYFRRVSRGLRIDQTRFTVLRRLVVFVIYSLGFAVAGSMIPGLSNLGVSILASAGILAVIVGFAAQQTFSNVISGVFIAIFEPFKVGDKITFRDEYGTIEDITLRHTVIKTWQEKRIVVPNSKISEEAIINYSLNDPRMLGTLEVGVSYDADVGKARKIMLAEARKHPDVLKEVRDDDNEFMPDGEVLKVRLVELTDFAQKMRLYYWAPDQSTNIKIRYDLTEAVKKRFDEEGIEVPFPYRTIVYKKDLK